MFDTDNLGKIAGMLVVLGLGGIVAMATYLQTFLTVWMILPVSILIVAMSVFAYGEYRKYYQEAKYQEEKE
ncbi:hypothetical protein KW786_02480 [Candidatus Parcubacteria bacterium]|nr:hypothetical protein [Candidatus Parcubacteria bacterium]